LKVDDVMRRFSDSAVTPPEMKVKEVLYVITNARAGSASIVVVEELGIRFNSSASFSTLIFKKHIQKLLQDLKN